MQQPKTSISFNFSRILLVAILSIFIQSTANQSFTLNKSTSDTEVAYKDLLVESMHDSHSENVSEERIEEREAFLNHDDFLSNIKSPRLYFTHIERLTALFEEVIPHPPELEA